MASVPHVKLSADSPSVVRPVGTSPARPTYCMYCFDIWYDDDADQRFVGHIGLDFEAHVDSKGRTKPNLLTGGSDSSIVKELEEAVKKRLKGTNKLRVPKPEHKRPEKVIVYKVLETPTKRVQLCFLVEPSGVGVGTPCPPGEDVLVSLEQMVTDGDPKTTDQDKRDSGGRLKPEYDPHVPRNWRPMKWRDGDLGPTDKDKPEDDKYDHRRKLKGPKFSMTV